jgi:hypothetical protein
MPTADSPGDAWSRFNNYKRPHVHIPQAAGRFYQSDLGVTTGTFAVAAGQLYASPIFIPKKQLFTVISIEVTTLSVGSVRLGIYRDSGGQPGALVADSGVLSTSTTGAKSATIAATLAPGWYWLASVFSVTPTVRAFTTGQAMVMLGVLANTEAINYMGVRVAFAFAALPDPFTGGSTLINASFPRVMIGWATTGFVGAWGNAGGDPSPQQVFPRRWAQQPDSETRPLKSPP